MAGPHSEKFIIRTITVSLWRIIGLTYLEAFPAIGVFDVRLVPRPGGRSDLLPHCLQGLQRRVEAGASARHGSPYVSPTNSPRHIVRRMAYTSLPPLAQSAGSKREPGPMQHSQSRVPVFYGRSIGRLSRSDSETSWPPRFRQCPESPPGHAIRGHFASQVTRRKSKSRALRSPHSATFGCGPADVAATCSTLH